MNIYQCLLDLFIGNNEGHVTYIVLNNKVKYTWVPVPPSIEAVREHLLGIKGLGIVPIDRDGLCGFAALDIDSTEEAELASLVFKNSKFCVFPSKSKGVHAYLFFLDRQKAASARTFLLSICDLLGLSNTESFPKQNELMPDKTGSPINLPLFGYLKDNLEECLIPIIDRMESLKLSNLDFSVLKTQWLYFAPTCLREGVKIPIKIGSRNEMLYKLAVYFNISLKELAQVKDILYTVKNLLKWDNWGAEEEEQSVLTIKSGLKNPVGKNCKGCRCFGKIQDERPVEMTGMFDLIEEAQSITLYRGEESLYIVKLKNGQMIQLTVEQLSSPSKLVNAVLGQINAVVKIPGNNNRLAWLVRFTKKAVIEELPNDAALHKIVMDSLRIYLKSTLTSSYSPLSKCFSFYDRDEKKHYFSFLPFHKYIVDTGCDITSSMLYYILIENNAKRASRSTVSGIQDLVCIDKLIDIELVEKENLNEDII